MRQFLVFIATLVVVLAVIMPDDFRLGGQMIREQVHYAVDVVA